ncbi:MAG: hypothetical protein HKN62_10630 [Phycisphaerales bacterium]|nr:hypothetical protein [Phycisphaerales bacterium]
MTPRSRWLWLIPIGVALLTALPASACPADLDDDDVVGFTDLLTVLSAWGPCPGCVADLDGSGDVGFTDLLTVLSAWGPCLFEYGPVRDNPEAEQIGLEILGPGGALVLDDTRYERIDRDLGLIRKAEPGLAGEIHTPAWAPNRIIVRRVAGADLEAYDALNAFFQITDEDHLFSDWYVLSFPGNLNIPALALVYTDLDAIDLAEPDGLIGGSNTYAPSGRPGETWRWNIDDGFHDCFDGCDCHRLYVIDVTADGSVSTVSYDEVGAAWCDFGP